MEPSTQTLEHAMRYYLKDRFPSEVKFQELHYDERSDGVLEMAFSLKIPGVGMALKTDREGLLKHIHGHLVKTFAENGFAVDKAANIYAESRKLSAQVEELTKKVSELQRFKDHYDLQFLMIHGDK